MLGLPAVSIVMVGLQIKKMSLVVSRVETAAAALGYYI